MAPQQQSAGFAQKTSAPNAMLNAVIRPPPGLEGMAPGLVPEASPKCADFSFKAAPKAVTNALPAFQKTAPKCVPEDSPKGGDKCIPCADIKGSDKGADFKGADKCADFSFNPKGADLSFCVCCNVSLKADPNHAFSEMHLSCMGRVLTDPLFCDCVLREVRPKKAETELVVSCESALKYFLKPRELLLIGSKGKRTAISGFHDMDIAAYMGPHEDPIEVVAERLNASNTFKVVQKDAKSVVAHYMSGHGLEVNIIPTSVPLKMDTWEVGWQLRHRDLFVSKPGWLKDAVRLLKIWVGPYCRVPGILLETVALQSEEPQKSKVRSVFLWSIELLAKGDIESWKDPLEVLAPSSGCSVMQAKNNVRQLRALSEYAAVTLEINDLEREKQCAGYGCTWSL